MNRVVISLFGAAAAGLSAVLFSSCASLERRVWRPASEASDVHTAAEDVERLLDDELLDGNGVYGCIKEKSDMSIWTQKGFYENSSMVQGAVLAAMSAKYRVTRDPEVLKKARWVFEGIRKIHELSRPGGKGFYCKPWDWQFQVETSSDQYVYAMFGLDAYYPLATEEEKRWIRSVIPDMVAFWIDRGYRYLYFGKDIDWPQCRFFAFMAYAKRYGGGKKFDDEWRRLLSDTSVTSSVPFRVSFSERRAKTAQGLIIYSVGQESALSGCLSIDAAVRYGKDHPYYRFVTDSISEVLTASMALDGTTMMRMVRTPDGRYVEMDPSLTVIDPVNPGSKWNSLVFRVCGPYRGGGRNSSAGVAALALMSDYDERSAAWVKKHAADVLLKIAHGPMSSIRDPHGLFPDNGIDVYEAQLRGEGLAFWLLGYWTLRERGIL